MKDTELIVTGGLIRQPTQPRAVRTVERILDAATRILVEEDYSALNTNRVAEEAGINIATLYSYFPDKLAIVKELAVRLEYRRTNYVVRRAQDLAHEDWRAWIEEIIDSVARFRRETYGGVAVRQAVIGIAELRYIDQQTTEEVLEAQVDGFLAHSSTLTRRQARHMSRLTAETTAAILDTVFRTKPYNLALIKELKKMAVAYLGTYLDK